MTPAEPTEPALAARARAVLCDTYARVPVTLVAGEGSWVTTDDGTRLLDCVGGIAVNVLGHAHPAWVAAITRQAARLGHTSNLYYTSPQVDLAERLVQSAFPSRVFFSNSGAEANETAIKVARKWGQRHRGGAHTIVTFAGAFHGRTLATLAATGSARYGDPFRPLPQGFRQVARGDPGQLAAAVDDEAVAVLVEPIQGEGGVALIGDDELRELRRLCDERDCLLLLDEVQSGMGRTGRMWAHQWAGIVPDVMTVAKGLAGGMPIGATLVGPRADVLEPGDHGSTFGGNPLACAAALAVLETLASERLIERADQVGEQLKEELLSLAAAGLPIAEIRGRGLMLGVGLTRPIAAETARAALAEGLLVNPIGDRTLRLVPPLILTEAEATLAASLVGRALATAAAGTGPTRG
ncbi:MAG TPA: acetylornithine transaminase [Candidatus Micrarchaeia archaeon]|nr:acetylornithine transaminase [Candidatus Micrarchaeia archaeon]